MSPATWFHWPCSYLQLQRKLAPPPPILTRSAGGLGGGPPNFIAPPLVPTVARYGGADIQARSAGYGPSDDFTEPPPVQQRVRADLQTSVCSVSTALPLVCPAGVEQWAATSARIHFFGEQDIAEGLPACKRRKGAGARPLRLVVAAGGSEAWPVASELEIPLCGGCSSAFRRR